MKRGQTKYILFLLLSISITSAVPSLNFQNENIQAGETILGTITTPGEFTEEIEVSALQFYQGRKKVYLESDIIFYKGIHYLYIYTTKSGNYTLRISNILYKESDILQSLTIEKQINITQKTNQTLTIKPGFIFTSQKPEIKLINSGYQQLNLTYGKNKTSINPQKTIKLSTIPTETFSNFTISTYKQFSIPIIYLKATKNTTFVSPSIKPDLRSNFQNMLVEIFTQNKTSKEIQFFNFGKNNITDIKVEHKISFLKIGKIKDMKPREAQNITLIFEPEIPGHFQNNLNITYLQNKTKHQFQISLDIFILPRGVTNKSFEIKKETCQEMSGQICKSGKEICNGTSVFTQKSEYCCLGLCVQLEEKTKSKNLGWIIGILILAVLLMLGYMLYKKQQNFKPQTPKDKITEVSKKFEKRMSGQSNRTTGNITKS